MAERRTHELDGCRRPCGTLLLQRASLLAALLCGALLTTSCEDDKQKPAATERDASADAGPSAPAVGGALGEAVSSAARQAGAPAAPGAAPAGGENAPPEKGVFAPGKADAVHAAGAPPRVEVLGKGDEPRRLLAPRFDAAMEQKVTAKLQLRLGAQQALPPVDLELSLRLDEPKASASPAAAGGAPVVRRVVARLTRAVLDPRLAGQPQARALGEALAKLEKSEVSFVLGPEGAAYETKTTLAKGADEGLEAILAALGEAISVLAVPVPAEPVGKGAYWMSTDRARSSEVGVVRYRVYRVEALEPEAAKLSVEIRQYAAESRVSAGEGPGAQSVEILGFDSQGKGELVVGPGAALPSPASLNQKVQAQVAAPGGAGQRMVSQTELTIEIVPVAAR